MMDIHRDYSGTQIGKYYLIQRLGNGSFGVVYRAFDVIMRQDKAIKIMEVTKPNEAYRLFNEAAIPRKCIHNNIIKINSGEIIENNDELLFIVDMELVNGESLDTLLKSSYISVADSLCYIRDVLFAVEYSHLQGIVHRDIKPANILIDKGTAKLSDFGLSTALGDVIKSGIWYCTHAAPETFVDDSIATVQTDIYALGVTLYRMVNGIADWGNFLSGIPNVEEKLRNGMLINSLPVAKYVPSKVHNIIKKACKKDPLDRYKSASDMRNAIDRLKLLYNWKNIELNYWRGEAIVRGLPSKEVYFDYNQRSVRVVVANNGRKSSKDSHEFTELLDAQNYMLEYIRDSTLD